MAHRNGVVIEDENEDEDDDESAKVFWNDRTGKKHAEASAWQVAIAS